MFNPPTLVLTKTNESSSLQNKSVNSLYSQNSDAINLFN